MLMEKDHNPIPEISIFPRLEKIGRGLMRLVTFLPVNAPDYMSNHYRGGAADMLDDQLQLDFEEQSETGW